jgi:exodeoxyribonuclease VII small subunit
VEIDMAVAKDIEKLSFEEALSELEEIVQKLEGGTVELEESIKIYTRGQSLKAHCEAKLKDAQARIEKIVVSGSGDISAETANLD